MNSHCSTSTASTLAVIMLAAGLGKRMRSELPKVLHPVAGRPMVLYPFEMARRLGAHHIAVVIGHQAHQVRAVVESALQQQPPVSMDGGVEMGKASKQLVLFAPQVEQLGTGHAVMQARKAILEARVAPATTYLILNGDTPLLTEQTVQALLACQERDGAGLTLLTARLEDPTGYGRIVRETGQGERRERPKGQVLRIVEDQDATADEAMICEINVGTYVVDGAFLFSALDELQTANAQKEYYLTDLVRLGLARGLRISAQMLDDPEEGMGINCRPQLAAAERVLRTRIAEYWMQQGVTVRDPATAWIDADAQIGQDTVLFPHVTVEGRSTLGRSCVVRSHVRITDCQLGDRVVIQDCCVVSESRLDDEAVVGPFAHVRPGSRIGRRAKVGNFVEIKKTELGAGSKANHLSYLGDAQIGDEVNIGAGTITCNYDGISKHETVVEDNVFIGSDSQLIAPVHIGRGAMIAAGSTICDDVPPDALAIARAAQVNREGWAAKRRARASASASAVRSIIEAKGGKGSFPKRAGSRASDTPPSRSGKKKG